MREQYTINCLLTVRDGDNDQVAAQARVWAILGLIGGSLAADHRLGGLVLSAHLGTWALTLTQTTVGATARLPFDVVIDAYTTT
jgi:hypothetical protein